MSNIYEYIHTCCLDGWGVSSSQLHDPLTLVYDGIACTHHLKKVFCNKRTHLQYMRIDNYPCSHNAVCPLQNWRNKLQGGKRSSMLDCINPSLSFNQEQRQLLLISRELVISVWFTSIVGMLLVYSQNAGNLSTPAHHKHPHYHHQLLPYPICPQRTDCLQQLRSTFYI